MSIEKEKLIHRKEMFAGKLIQVFQDEAMLAGRKVTREVVKHQEACAIIPLTDDGKVLFVEQYRYPIEQAILEIPAGKVDPGEDAMTCAVRELEEEAGVRGHLTYLGKTYTTPGFCNEVIHLYLAVDLVHTHQHLDEGEFLNVVPIPLTEAWDMIHRGELTDAKSLAAFAMASDRLK
jgi:ADP-ribose pyrophosphatase